MSLVHSLLGASAACRHASVPCLCSASASSRIGQVEGLRYASTSRTSSRTRLANDLTPRPPRSRDSKGFQKPSKLLDVARRGPKPDSFSRDNAPHRERREPERPHYAKKPDYVKKSDYGKKPDYANKSDRAPSRGPRDFKSKGREGRPSWGDRMSREADATASHRNTSAPRPRSTAPSSVTEEEGIEAEFDFSTPTEPRRGLPKQFSSPPLVEGLVESVHDLLGQDVRPTPIQSLSLKHLFTETEEGKWREFLLASETGSGKSLAYLLPVLQALKQTELLQPADQPGVRHSPNLVRPRAIVLAPTHELSRQLSGFAKALIHHIKLRVTTASRSNVASTAKTGEMEIRKAGRGG
ncbi:hypothetical protein EVG20_g11415 [Dentipellis fragilis]|uniref:RNA helicase n=1 Tax=Dentipellis fragilis TaxID=205917 RepID=A0A4Y9XKT8_9AGAM|nr:hypothetical protein EVG20_g11415 [Dentipellis fragilis]